MKKYVGLTALALAGVFSALALGSSQALTMGESLPARLPESTGSVTVVSNVAGLNSALSSVSNGARIQLHAGDYEGVNITRVASAFAPITIEEYPGEQATFSSSGSQKYPLKISGQYIRVRGVEIIDPAGSSSTHVYFLGDNCELDKVDIHGNGTATDVQGIFSDSGSTALQVWNSKIHNVGVLENNDHGWYMEGSNHLLVNSIIYGIDKGYGVQVYPVASDNVIAANTIVNNAWKSGVLVGTHLAASNVQNNLFINNVVTGNNPSYYSYDGYQNGTNNDVSDSLVWDPTDIDDSAGGIQVGSNITEANPSFLKPGTYLFKLAASHTSVTTPANSAYMPATDHYGVTRTRVVPGAVH